jgi:hypothetical protein
MALAAYNFELFYRPEKLNSADAPSRRPDYVDGEPVDSSLLSTL